MPQAVFAVVFTASTRQPAVTNVFDGTEGGGWWLCVNPPATPLPTVLMRVKAKASTLVTLAGNANAKLIANVDDGEVYDGQITAADVGAIADWLVTKGHADDAAMTAVRAAASRADLLEQLSSGIYGRDYASLARMGATRESALYSAEGWGALTVGGTGTTTVHVTNLNDSGDGSLRAALALTTPRYIVFDVAGYIDLQTQLEILTPYCTIAGDTAPEPGITLRKAAEVEKLGSIGACLKIGRMAYGDRTKYCDVHDVIVRHLHLRHGDGLGDVSAGLCIHSGYNILIDHCSFEWSPDNLMLIWLAINDPPISNVTVQRCLFAEAFRTHSTGLAIHGYYDFTDPVNPNETYKRLNKISVHHNMFANNSHRQPMSRTSGIEVINNVIYNFDYKVFQPNADDVADYVNNYIKCGPQQTTQTFLGLEHQWSHQLIRHGAAGVASIYSDGNTWEGINTAAADDWANWCLWIDAATNTDLDAAHRRLVRQAQPPVPVTASDADAALVADILADCGAMLPARDTVDARIVNEVATDTGWATAAENVAEAGGWPE